MKSKKKCYKISIHLCIAHFEYIWFQLHYVLRCYAADGVVALPRIETTLLPSRLRLLSPFWMALLTAGTTHFFLQLEEAILIKTQNLDHTSLQLFIILNKNDNIGVSAIKDFFTLIYNNKCCSLIFQSWNHFFIRPVICCVNLTMIAGWSFFSVPRLSRY